MSITDRHPVDVEADSAQCRDLAHLVRNAVAAELRGRAVSVRYHYTSDALRAFRPARSLTYSDSRLWI